MFSMKTHKILGFCILLATMISLTSCAGILAKSTAESEFETGFSLFNRGKYDEAITHFERAAELVPDFGKAYLYIGRSYLNLGKWREALPPLRTAYRLAPDETKQEIADIIMDIILKNTLKFDKDTELQFLDLLKPR